MKPRFLPIIIFVLLSVGFGSAGYAQISPGELSQVHTQLEGMTNCTKCHTLGQKVSNDKCLACHTELKARIARQKGYHSTVLVRGRQCSTCHNDHHGLNFQIVRFDKNKFNHSLTGYKLTGAHARQICSDCHKATSISDPKIVAKKFTYLGLKTDCSGCHKDYHQKSLSANCASCHNDEKFKPATKFDHNRAKFKLSGKHQQVDCAECHKITTQNGVKFQEFKGKQAARCTSCHKDVHNNNFGQNCIECHNNESFHMIGGVQHFDHSKADFQLEGKHRSVACKSCHKGKLTAPVNHKHCNNCHADYHNKDFAKNGISPDCATCHNINGFTEFAYTLEQHNAGIFPLRGAHLATPCSACHKKTDQWKFKQIGKTCKDCHENIHLNFIDPKYYPGANCEMCHNVSRWNAISFDHKNTGFALEGAHAQKTCRDCHFNKEITGHARQKFKGLGTACTTCHKDVHMQQFEAGGITDCKQCHNTDSFKPASKFDHGKTRFVLDGKHVSLSCGKCHSRVTKQEVSYVFYKINKLKCEDCHR